MVRAYGPPPHRLWRHPQVLPYDLYPEMEAQAEQVRFDAATLVTDRIDAVVADPTIGAGLDLGLAGRIRRGPATC